MPVESEPNVIYGGDPNEWGPIGGVWRCGSVGELIVNNLKEGGNRTAFVR